MPFVVLDVFIITMYYLRWLKMWQIEVASEKKTGLKLMTFLVTISKLRWYHSHLSIRIVAI